MYFFILALEGCWQFCLVFFLRHSLFPPLSRFSQKLIPFYIGRFALVCNLKNRGNVSFEKWTAKRWKLYWFEISVPNFEIIQCTATSIAENLAPTRLRSTHLYGPYLYNADFFVFFRSQRGRFAKP